MKRHIVTLVLTALATCFASAKVTLPHIFADGMVMQQQTNANIWGTAKASATVKIGASWSKSIMKATADKDGKWSISIATPEAGGPYTITIDDGEKLTLSNILIGEVWICSGQSNMEMPMEGFKGQPVEGATEELMNCTDKQLRLFTVKRNSQFTPTDDVTGVWSEANAETVREFSATAYYFGKQLRRSLDVPVGLIVTSWGGSACEAWMTAEWLKAFPDAKIPQSAADIKSKNRTPTVLFNGMLHPLIGYTMRGVIWYQGEDNIPRYKTYADMLSTMIRGWRSLWKQGDFPFYYCQIAPFDYELIGWKTNSALLREQQSKVERMVENCEMAVLVDAGLKYGIHPRKKREAGERLAMLALSDTYGMKGLSKSARYESAEFKGDTAEVRFDRSRMWVYFQNGTTSDNFEIAGSDKIFHKAKAWIEKNRVYVTCPEVKNPVAVRYAFRNWVEGDLFCDGLPISSFRTDDWDDVNVDNSKGKEYDIH